MIWKIVIKLLGRQRGNYIKAVSMKDGDYIINIYKFVPVNKDLCEWENALKKSRAQC